MRQHDRPTSAGGTTDIAVISLTQPVVDFSLKVAGDKFDEAIVKHVRRKHNVLIGERTAEDLKINIGCAYPREEELSMEIRGRNLITGMPAKQFRSIQLKCSKPLKNRSARYSKLSIRSSNAPRRN